MSLSDMTNLLLDYSPEEAQKVMKEAFRRTEGIIRVEEGSYQIVGKTGIQFPRVLWSWGENVYVDFSDQTDNGKIPIEVWADKAIWMNIGSNPEKFKRRFLDELKEVREQPIEELPDEPVDIATPESSSWAALVGFLGYPAFAILGALVGAISGLFLIGAVSYERGQQISRIGIFVGLLLGPIFWYNRKKTVPKDILGASKYLSLAVLGIFPAAAIETVLGTQGAGSVILMLAFMSGIPLVAYRFRDQLPVLG